MAATTSCLRVIRLRAFAKRKKTSRRKSVVFSSRTATPTIFKDAAQAFFAFSRAEYGIVKIRTDGKRLLVYTNSGQSDLKEAYAYEADDKGKIQPAAVRKV